jgi:hypothetical protein
MELQWQPSPTATPQPVEPDPIRLTAGELCGLGATEGRHLTRPLIVFDSRFADAIIVRSIWP